MKIGDKALFSTSKTIYCAKSTSPVSHSRSFW